MGLQDWLADPRYSAERRLILAVPFIVLILIGGIAAMVIADKRKNEPPADAPAKAASVQSSPATSTPTPLPVNPQTERADRVYAEAIELMNRGEIAGAEQAVIEITGPDENPTPSVWNLLGVLQGLQSRHDEAIVAFGKAVESEPQNFRFLMNLCITQQRLGQYENALKTLEQMQRLEPVDAVVITKTMLVKIQAGRIADVRNELLLRKQVSPANGAGHGAIVEAAMALSENDVVAASRHFTQARSILTPESYRALIDDPFFAPYASVATLTPFFLQSTLSP